MVVLVPLSGCVSGCVTVVGYKVMLVVVLVGALVVVIVGVLVVVLVGYKVVLVVVLVAMLWVC